MRFLCDVHISFKLVKFLREKGFETIHVNNILNGYRSKDSEISEYCDDFDFILISKDSDFRHSYLLKKVPKKLLWITLGNISNKDLIEVINNCLKPLENLESRPNFMMEIRGTSNYLVY
jgi:predicted nuclease of predicted toxin-antitoxin system